MTRKPYKFNRRQLEWLQALESGDYTQGRHKLVERNIDGCNAFCCLGVAAELQLEDRQQLGRLSGMDALTGSIGFATRTGLNLRSELGEFALGSRPDHEENSLYGYKYTYEKSDGTMMPMKEAIATGECVSGSLANMNDNGWTFREIAKFIRQHPRYVFSDQQEG